MAGLLQGATDIEINNTFLFTNTPPLRRADKSLGPPAAYLRSSDVGYKQSQKLPVIYT